jgi:hypothetical protein
MLDVIVGPIKDPVESASCISTYPSRSAFDAGSK